MRRPPRRSLNHSLRLVLHLLIGLGALAGLYIALARWSVESRQTQVELVADWRQVQSMATFSNVPLDALLRDLKAHGVYGMAVGEDTIAGLRDDGYLIVEADPLPNGGARTLISSIDPALLNRVRQHLLPKLSLKVPLATVTSPSGQPALIWPGSFEQIRTLNVGLPPAEVKRLQGAGFDVVARIVNYQAANPANIEWSLNSLSELGIYKVIFGGEETLGYKAQVKETAALLQRHHLTYGSVEFSKQRGDEEITLALQGDYLRVHSITPTEMNKIQPADMLERYVRAAEERNIRVAFVRLLPWVTQNGWQDQWDFLNALTTGLRKVGLTPGLAHAYPEPVPDLWRYRILRAVMGLGAAAAGVLLLTFLIPLGEGVCSALLGGWGIIHVALLFLTLNAGRKLVALEAAILFPSLAMVGVYAFVRRRWQEDRAFSPLVAYLAVAGVSALGVVYEVGLLSSREYMMKAQQFAGIKVAHLLPLLLFAIVLALDFVVDYRTRHEMMADARRRVRRVVSQPLLVWQLVAGLIALVAVAMLLLRTGNDPGVAVSPLEMRFRSLLDRALYVRPRTKEFLIGHPAMLLGLMWAAAQVRGAKASGVRWRLARGGLALLLLVGGIGQVSLVNTFSHIHTPLYISVVRVFNGLWVGALLGLLLYRLLPRGTSPAASEEETARSMGAGI